MNDISELERAFSQLLRDESERTAQLLDLLRQEYQALQSSSPESLEQLTVQKQHTIKALDGCVAAHNRFLLQQELTPDRQGTAAFLACLPPASRISVQWIAFEATLEDCRKQNEINGSILAHSQRQIRYALDLLRGVTAGQKTYGPLGESRSNHLSNTLGKA